MLTQFEKREEFARIIATTAVKQFAHFVEMKTGQIVDVEEFLKLEDIEPKL